MHGLQEMRPESVKRVCCWLQLRQQLPNTDFRLSNLEGHHVRSCLV